MVHCCSLWLNFVLSGALWLNENRFWLMLAHYGCLWLIVPLCVWIWLVSAHHYWFLLNVVYFDHYDSLQIIVFHHADCGWFWLISAHCGSSWRIACFSMPLSLNSSSVSLMTDEILLSSITIILYCSLQLSQLKKLDKFPEYVVCYSVFWSKVMKVWFYYNTGYGSHNYKWFRSASFWSDFMLSFSWKYFPSFFGKISDFVVLTLWKGNN